jgi:hypothetical protein
VLDLDGCTVLVRATATSLPFIWFKGGIAHAIPRSAALAEHVALNNKDLMAGRVYLALGDEIAMAVYDDAIFGASLSLDYDPSIQDVVNRFDGGLKYTSEWSQAILSKFGGQPFRGDDWYLMSL